jgi:hypothetical protein
MSDPAEPAQIEVAARPAKSAAIPGQRVVRPATSAAPGLPARRRFTAAVLGIAIGLLAVAVSAGLGLLLASAIFGYGGLG